MTKIDPSPHARGSARPSLAVVIPCYNAERWLGHAIASVLDQNYPGLELIVVDDGSTDASAQVVASFGDRVRALGGRNRGACVARNRGAAAATSDFVLFLDADDFLVGDYLWRLAACAGPGVDVVVGGHARVDGDGRRGATTIYGDLRGPVDLLVTYLKTPVQTGGFLWRREALIEAGGWGEALPFYQDIELGLRMLLRLPPYALAPLGGAIAAWRVHEGPRLSTHLSSAKIDAVLQALAVHEPALVALGENEANQAMAGVYYSLACAAFASGCRSSGKLALARARRLGLRGHNGSLAHRVTSGLIGLELKTRLTSALYEFRGDLPHHQRPYPYNVVAG